MTTFTDLIGFLSPKFARTMAEASAAILYSIYKGRVYVILLWTINLVCWIYPVKWNDLFESFARQRMPIVIINNRKLKKMFMIFGHEIHKWIHLPIAISLTFHIHRIHSTKSGPGLQSIYWFRASVARTSHIFQWNFENCFRTGI